MTENEEWVAISVAARRLHLTKSRLGQIIKRKSIKTIDDSLDSRVKLVEFTALKRMFTESVQFTMEE